MKKNKYNDLKKNTILFTISSFSSKILSFLLVPLYTSVLSTADYGTADMVYTTSSLIVFAVALNISDAVLRYVIDIKDRQSNILGYGIRVTIKGNLIFAILVYFFSKLNIIEWEGYLYIFLVLHVFVSSFVNLFSNYLRAIDKIREVAISGIVATFFTIISNIVFLVVLKIGIVGYLISMIVGPLFSLLYCMRTCDNLFVALKENKIDRKLRNEMLIYCLPLILNGITWWINSSLDNYFIVGYCNVSDNGIYSVSQKIPTILTTFSSFFLQAWNLSAIKEFDREDKDGFFSNTYNFLNAGLVILCSSIILCNIPLANILYGKDFFEAWKCSSWLLISTVFSAISSYEGSIFAACKKSSITAISTVVAASINIVFNFILIPRIGIQGAAIATVISFMSVCFLRLICLRNVINMRINIFRNCFTYCLLVAQVIFERTNGYGYLGQIGCMIIILWIYRDYIILFVKKIFLKYRNYRK